MYRQAAMLLEMGVPVEGALATLERAVPEPLGDRVQLAVAIARPTVGRAVGRPGVGWTSGRSRWYLAGHCHGGPRLLRVDRILAAEDLWFARISEPRGRRTRRETSALAKRGGARRRGPRAAR